MKLPVPSLPTPPATSMPPAECIFYRGKRVLVEVVQSLSTRQGHGVDSLLVDTKGRYYYRRQRWKPDRPGDGPPTYTLLHRLSLLAAILWELGLDGTNGHSVLRDATNALLRHSIHVYALDPYAQRLVQYELRDHPRQDARDLVNAGVYFLLGNENLDSQECKAKARQRRLTERKEATT